MFSSLSQKIIIGALLLIVSCAPDPRFRSTPLPEDQRDETVRRDRRTGQDWRYAKEKPDETGIASFVADEMQGRATASGETYNMRERVAAHRTLPFNSIVRVTNLENGKSVDVRIVDRGPFVKDRVIDLSFEAAKELDFIREGQTQVELRVIRVGK